MEVARLTLAVMTVDRAPQYVHQTLASLFAADPLVHGLDAVHLVVGASSAAHLGNYRHHTLLQTHPLSPEESERIVEWTIYRRFCHNYVRCLSLPIADGGGICVCEDDIVFRDEFLRHLLATVDEMDEDGLRDYCLALFTPYDSESNPSLFRGTRFCKYGESFYGTQCMYYPKHVAEELRGHIQRHGVDDPTKPGDLLIADLYGDRMYACPRALANHIGAVSTGLGGCGGSPSFHRLYLPLRRDEWGSGPAVEGATPHPGLAIPKVFHQIWVGDRSLPATATEFADTWRRHHPGWDLRLWTDENLPDGLVNRDIYEQTTIPAQRADILRHEVLYQFGGVYLDTDFECLRNIEPLLSGATYFYADELPGMPSIGILGCTPRHEFARWCLDRVPERWPWKEGEILNETGPGFFRRAIVEYLGERQAIPLFDPLSRRAAGNMLVPNGKPRLQAFHPWVFYPYYLGEDWVPEAHTDAYAVHHWHKSW